MIRTLLAFGRFYEMKNMIRKMLADLAVLTVMMSVVMPCAAGGGATADGPTYELWDEDDLTNRD